MKNFAIGSLLVSIMLVQAGCVEFEVGYRRDRLASGAGEDAAAPTREPGFRVRGDGRVAHTQVWADATEWEECTRDRYVDNFTNRKQVKLVRNVLVADEMGKAYNTKQNFSGKTWAKKILMLDSADVKSAQLMIWGSVGEIVVNGVVAKTKRLKSSYWNNQWSRYMIPVNLLKAGANEFIFRGGGWILLENCKAPNRSAVSRDGGHSWDFDRMAAGGSGNGEFLVRLKLERYAPAGWIASPILDLARTAKNSIPSGIAPRIDVFEIEGDLPAGAAVERWVRFGPTPDGAPEHWTRWYRWGKDLPKMSHRFAQWKLVLRTAKAQQTPTVRKVILITSAAPAKSPPELKIVENGNQAIVRSSYRYAYTAYNGNLTILRNHWKLDNVVAGKKTEIERFVAMRQWVRDQWKKGWDTGALKYVPSWDARIILTLASKNLSLGMCTHYANTFVQCSQAVGLTSRDMVISHFLSESWSNEHGRWMVMDAGADPNDKRRCTYHYVRNGKPLSLLDLHRAHYIDKNTKGIKIVQTNMSAGSDKPERPFKSNDDKKMFDHLASIKQIFMPMRNNFIDQREPQEPEHGMGHFKYLGDLFWKDEETAHVPWTDFFTTRAADLYWTLNQAQIFLRAGGKKAGTLEVMLDTVTPNFVRYEIRIDGGTWTALAKGTKSFGRDMTGKVDQFAWSLHKGKNSLEARTVNQAGHPGIVSRIVIDK